MQDAIIYGSGVATGAFLLGLAMLFRDGSRAEEDAQRIAELEADARKYARAWAELAKRSKARGTLRSRLAQMGGNSAA